MRKSLLVLVVLLLPGCFDALNPLERDADEAGVTIRVDKCEQDRTSEVVTATYTVTSEQDYDNVLLDGKLKDATGTVVASTSGSVQNVKAGEPVQNVMSLSPQGSYEKPLDCEITLNFAQQPLG